MKIEAKVHYSGRKKRTSHKKKLEKFIAIETYKYDSEESDKIVGFDTKVYFDLARFAF